MPDSPTPSAAPETPKAGASELQQRIIFGVLGAALLLGSVWYGPVTFGLFFAFVQAVMLWEFYKMMKAGGYAPATWWGIFLGVLIFVFVHSLHIVHFYTNHHSNDENQTVYPALNPNYSTFEQAYYFNWQPKIWQISGIVALLTIVGTTIYEIVRWPKFSKPFSNISTLYGGLLYVSIPMALLNIIALGQNGYDYRRIFGLLFLIWASDIGAYMAGKTFGKHKLAPKISPGKTWEGWAGGVLLTLAVGWALKLLLPDVPLAHLLVAAGVVAVFGPLGDLAESMLKRSVGVKDSGRIMPGHGGLLDRFDAFLLVLPVLALLQLLL